MPWKDRRKQTMEKLATLSEFPVFDLELFVLSEAALGEVCASYSFGLELCRALRLLPVLNWLEETEGYIGDIAVRVITCRYDRTRAADIDILCRYGILELVSGSDKRRQRSKTNVYRMSAQGRKIYHTYISTYGNLRADLLQRIHTKR